MKTILVVMALACGFLPLTAGCASNSHEVDSGVPIDGEGTVHQGVGPECPTVWHVATSKGLLWPVEDPAFQIEGLRVRFKAREVSTASICMAGKTVEFDLIEKL